MTCSRALWNETMQLDGEREEGDDPRGVDSADDRFQLEGPAR